MTENYSLLRDIAVRDVGVLQQKGEHYGDSWRKRGGVGAFMMLARKWDRIENMATKHGYDIFQAEAEGVLEDVADLRRYLLLVEGHITETLKINAQLEELSAERPAKSVPVEPDEPIVAKSPRPRNCPHGVAYTKTCIACDNEVEG